MTGKTRLITVGGTFLCALGIGFFMQNTANEPQAALVEMEPVARADFKPLSQPAFPIQQSPVASVDMTDLVPVAPNAEPSFDVAALGETLPLVQPEPEVAEPICDITSVATVEAGAMVRLDVSAPCLVNERAVVHHNGLMFTAVTDQAGDLSVSVPALSEMAVLVVSFANGEGSVATAEVSSLWFYDRVALQWAGETGFQLHAREYGAEYCSEGHVWSGAARDVTAAAMGEGGFVTQLGVADTLAPLMAEVYTFPTGTASKSGEINLSIEAEVTAQNCAREIEAQSIELQKDGQVRTQYLTLNVPDCDSVGDFLVLKNLVDDLKVAVN